ncbi:MAG TPA: lipocalin-like domain-containing protein [Mycobacterium sp.]|nr:lipocalin-like domain-containing protein [Mycobacterium sp.]
MLREKILGAWRLVSYVEQDDRGGPVTFPLGRDAVGLIIYTSDGYMSAQLMRSGRHAYEQPDIAGGTTAQAAAAAEGYLAYSGPYDVDESASVVHHRVAVSLLPNWLGTVQLRHGSLKDNQLTLVAEIPLREAIIRSTLVWARAPDHHPSG